MDISKALSITAIAGLSSAILGNLVVPQGVAAFTISGGGYTATNQAYSFTDISKTGTSLFTGSKKKNDVAAIANIGFTFNFFGTNYNQIGVSSNGLLTFGGLNTSPNNINLNTQASSLPTLAVLWDDWNLGTAGGVFTKTQKVGGQNALIVQWNNVLNKNSGAKNPATFEAILFANGTIQLNYQSIAVGGIANNGGSATVGIANGDDSKKKRLQWSYNTPFSTYQTSIVFKPTTSPGKGGKDD